MQPKTKTEITPVTLPTQPSLSSPAEDSVVLIEGFPGRFSRRITGTHGRNHAGTAGQPQQQPAQPCGIGDPKPNSVMTELIAVHGFRRVVLSHPRRLRSEIQNHQWCILQRLEPARRQVLELPVVWSNVDVSDVDRGDPVQAKRPQC